MHEQILWCGRPRGIVREGPSSRPGWCLMDYVPLPDKEEGEDGHGDGDVGAAEARVDDGYE